MRARRLDLHFAPFDRACEVTRFPGDLAVLMVGIAERQSASATARAQARLCEPAAAGAEPLLFRPAHGSFHRAMAALVDQWREE